MGCNSSEFGKIGLCKFTAAHEVFCEAKGIAKQKAEKSSSYNNYLDLKDRLEPVIAKNKDKLKQARNKIKKR